MLQLLYTRLFYIILIFFTLLSKATISFVFPFLESLRRDVLKEKTKMKKLPLSFLERVC